MRTGKKLTAEILSGKWDEALKKLYMDNQKIQQQKKRYVKAVASYCEIFGEMPVEIYSAPGRSEVGGNHTDHQHGRVLAASVSLDAIAVAGRVDEPLVRIQSEGYKLCEIRLDELDKKTREEGMECRPFPPKKKGGGQMLGKGPNFPHPAFDSLFRHRPV